MKMIEHLQYLSVFNIIARLKKTKCKESRQIFIQNHSQIHKFYSFLPIFIISIQFYQQTMSKVLTAIGRKLVTDHFALQALAIQAGATIQKLEHGEVHIKLPKHPLLIQHHSNFHGGVIAYLGDISGGLASISCMTDPSHSSVTVELKTNFLKPAVGNYLIGKGRVISEGGSLIVAATEIYTEDNVLAAFLVQTNKRLVPKHKHHHKAEK